MERMQRYNIALTEYFITGVKENTILLVEPNDCHGEVIPGFAKYILDLGYAIDILMVWELSWMDPLCRLDDTGIRKIIIPHSHINDFFNNDQIIKNYKKIFFTSFRVYRYLNNEGERSVFEHYPNVQKYTGKFIAVEHHLDKCDKSLLRQDKIITLEAFDPAGENTLCNPHYFGPVKMNQKNHPITEFIVVGKIEKARRNHYLLIDAVKKLEKSGINHFKITVIGFGRMPDIPAGLRRYFNFMGTVDFPTMYNAMEGADFFLPLLDIDLPVHKRYIDHATSGSFQLIYGFEKPCIIQRPFASKRGLTERNSLLYDKNGDLALSMGKAVKMTAPEYEAMRHDLQKLTERLYADSLTNLERIIGGRTIV
jgi:hypothetical protein